MQISRDGQVSHRVLKHKHVMPRLIFMSWSLSLKQSKCAKLVKANVKRTVTNQILTPLCTCGCFILLHIYTAVYKDYLHTVWVGSGPGVQKIGSFTCGHSGWNCPCPMCPWHCEGLFKHTCNTLRNVTNKLQMWPMPHMEKRCIEDTMFTYPFLVLQKSKMLKQTIFQYGMITLCMF